MLVPSQDSRPTAWRRGTYRAGEWLRRRGVTPWLELAWLAVAGAQRDPARLAGALGRLKGPFAKLGQLAGLRVDAVQPETREHLTALRDRVPPLPFWRIAELLRAEFQQPLDEVFATLDPEPLGAASIAQVHRGRLPDGREVAVKVQYPWLRSTATGDLALLERVLRRMLPESGATGLFAEFARSFREELDFRREASMAREIASHLDDDPQLVVPEVIDSHSTGRVLTMAWYPTLSLQQPDELRARSVPMAEVLEHLVRAYSRQIFVDGLFHADPHAGNLFVIDEPSATSAPRVLFVDFGLSQRLDPELRRELRQGIYAVLKADLDAFLAGMDRMDMIEPGHEAEVRKAVGSMFERLRGEAGGALGLAGDRILALKDEATTLLYETPGLRLPAQLLLYAKTLSYVFGLGREISPETDVMKLAVPYLLRFLSERDDAAP